MHCRPILNYTEILAFFQELLRAWQRHSSFDTDADLKTRLDALREFLRKEVDKEERITLTVYFLLKRKVLL